MAVPLLALLAGGALAGGLLNRRSGAERAAAGAMQRETVAAGGRAGQAGAQAQAMRGRYLDMLGGYNPQDYARETAGAIGGEMYEELGRTDAARRTALNRRGFSPGSSIGTGRQTEDFNMR